MTRCTKHGMLNCALCSDQSRFIAELGTRTLDDPEAWSIDDDRALLAFIETHQHPAWTAEIPTLMEIFERRYPQVYMRGMRISGEGFERGWLGQWPSLKEEKKRLGVDS